MLFLTVLRRAFPLVPSETHQPRFNHPFSYLLLESTPGIPGKLVMSAAEPMEVLPAPSLTRSERSEPKDPFLSPNPIEMNTCEKFACNSSRMNTSKIAPNNPLYNQHLQKNTGGTPTPPNPWELFSPIQGRHQHGPQTCPARIRHPQPGQPGDTALRTLWRLKRCAHL